MMRFMTIRIRAQRVAELAQHSLISEAVDPAVQGAHMTYPPVRLPASCFIAEVQPLLAELRDDIGMRLADTSAVRASLLCFFRVVFWCVFVVVLFVFFFFL